jgi:predicted phosphodiesterase
MKVVKSIRGYSLERLLPNDVKPANWIRIVVISDTHGKVKHLNIPDGDVLIDCGDLTFRGIKTHLQEYTSTINSLPHKHKIIIGGNHDVCLDEEKRKMLELDLTDI